MNEKEFIYTKEHEWLEKTFDGSFRVGITDYAQSNLGDVVFVELPTPDQMIVANESICIIESVKAVSDVYAPVDGTIVQVNNKLLEDVSLINKSPFDQGWICTIKLKNLEDISLLLGYEQYQEYLKTL